MVMASQKYKKNRKYLQKMYWELLKIQKSRLATEAKAEFTQSK